MSHKSAFKTAKGEAEYLQAYNAAMKCWPVPYQDIEIPTRFGTTHVIVSGPEYGSPLVLLHGYMATSIMWAPNIADLSEDYRVYAINVMGQPSKSIPKEPIRDAADYAIWLTDALDALHLDRVSLVGCSFGGWIALNYAAATSERVHRLVLLSPGGLLPIAKQFRLRGMLMMFFPTRFTVNSFMRWAGFGHRPGHVSAQPVLDLMYFGMKHFRMPRETLRIAANPLSDDELRAMHVPTLLLIGEQEVLCDAATALARARRLIPHFQGELLPGCRHDMVFTEHGIVDTRIVDFLKRTAANGHESERFVA